MVLVWRRQVVRRVKFEMGLIGELEFKKVFDLFIFIFLFLLREIREKYLF